jgi:hypothetical protein
MSTSTWTIEDLAMMTQRAADLAIIQSNQQYCRHCTVTPVSNTDMCDPCIAALVLWLEESDTGYYDRLVEEAIYQQQFSLHQGDVL